MRVIYTLRFASLLIFYYSLSFVKCDVHYSEGETVREDGFQGTLGHLRPSASPQVQAEAATEVVRRLLGDDYKLFPISINQGLGPVGKDTFMVAKNRLGEIEILGNSGVAAVWGLHYYLKHYCNSHIAWEGSQISLPNVLPDVNFTITSNDRFRYYQNVCTAGYSTAWWDWSEWEKHIDWMALNGINLALAFHGQEAIWDRVYLALNLTREEIDEQFGGPAFLPWARMGNIRGWGGPLPSSWHQHTVELQHKILTRMRSLGIIPVLPAFAGHVPRAFARLFPGANLTRFDPWNGFNDQFCCPFLLEPMDPLFKKVGTMFLEEYINEFGTDHVYNCDTFNENEPQRTELQFLSRISGSIYSAIAEVDPDGIWILQGWLFLHELSFWTEPRVKAFVTAVPIGKMIVLDLQSEQYPQYERLNSYYGQPFIWCMLHNFGGTLGLFGSANIINTRVFEGRNMENSTMVGTGLTPEGINQNYVVYELMNEMAYRRKPADLELWFENYATRRYGAWNEYAVSAWQKLRKTVYDFKGLERIRGKYVVTRHPSLKIRPWAWYNPEDLLSAWDTLLKARYGRSCEKLYRHDVVDLTRQGMQLTLDTLYLNTIASFRSKNLSEFRENARLFLEALDDLERILASSDAFLLGKWLESAKSLAKNNHELELYEYNARNQITLWGPNGEIRDYASKQWSGVVADYFKPRWSLFFDYLNESLANGIPFNSTETDEAVFSQAEEPFTFSRNIYPVTPNGDSIKIAVELNNKWRKIKPSSKIKVIKRNDIRVFKYV